MRGAGLIFAVGLAGCAEAPAPGGVAQGAAGPSAVENVYWRLSKFAGETPGPVVSLTFDGERLRGEGPCNRYFGGYVLDGDSLGVGAVAATRRACPNLVFEQRYFAALTEVKGYVVDHKTLTLVDGDGVALMQFDS